MDIEEKIENVTNKVYEVLGIDNKRKRVFSVIGDIVHSVCAKYSKIGIFGTGEHTRELFQRFQVENVILFIDKNPDIESCFEMPVVRPNDNLVFGLECIIISSYMYRKEMVFALVSQGYKGYILDIYDEAERRGVFLDRVFYQTPFPGFSEIFLALNGLQFAESIERKSELMGTAIVSFLEVRDFQSAIKYMELYVENEYDNYVSLKGICDSFKKVLSDIKKRIQNRKKKDIIIHWIDGLGNDTEAMPFLQDEIASGIMFNNAFTVVPWTSSVIENLCFGELNIEGKLFDKDLPFSNSPLIKEAEANGYRFVYAGAPDRALRFFGDNSVYSMKRFQTRVYSLPSTIIRWEAIKALYEADTPLVLLIHSLYETHEFVSPYGCLSLLYDTNDCCARGIVDVNSLDDERHKANNYADKQMKWFSDFLSEDSIRIYFSDHGPIYGWQYPFEDVRSRVFLCINSTDINSMVYDGLFSLVNFRDVLKHIYSCDYNFDDVVSDYIRLQGYDMYSKENVIAMLEGCYANADISIMQYRGIRSCEDKYVRYIDGREFYFRFPDEKTNLINDKKYRNRISLLRDLNGTNYIDVFKYDKFIATVLLYQKLKLNIEFDEDGEHVFFE